MSYSYATCKPYTQISPLHDKSLVGISEEWLQHHLINPNSDSASGINSRLYCDPTRILLLVAIAKAPHLRFGVPPSTTIVSRLLLQRLSASIPASFDLTFLVRLSTLVQRICTEFLFNSDRFSYKCSFTGTSCIQHHRVEVSILVPQKQTFGWLAAHSYPAHLLPGNCKLKSTYRCQQI